MLEWGMAFDELMVLLMVSLVYHCFMISDGKTTVMMMMMMKIN